jgi:hypothetical protein
MTGHGCGCGKSSCNVCSHSHHNHCSSWGKDVYYGNDNLRRFFVSCGENFDAIIEKAFNFTADVKESFLEFEQETLEKFTAFTVELNAIKIRLAALEAGGGGGSTDLTQILADILALKGQMTTVISNIGTLSNLTTTAKTNLVAAINEIDADLTALSTSIGNLSTLNNAPGVTTQATTVVGAINDRQPVWKKSLNVTVGSSQTAPFNTIDSAINELAKYHFDSNLLVIKLEDGTHTITPAAFHKLNVNYYTVESLSGNRANCILTSTGQTIANGLQYADFKNLTIKSTGTQGTVVGFSNNSQTQLFNCIIETGTTNTSAVTSYENGYVGIRGCKIVNKATNPINLVFASDNGVIYSGNLEVDNSLGSNGSNLYLAQVNSNIEVIYVNPVSTTVVDNISTVFTTYLNSRITILSYGEFTYSNIGFGFILCQDGSSIIHRAQNNLGVSLNTTVTGRSLTSGGNGATILAVYTNSSVNTTKITANTFNRAMYVWANSKLTGEIAISNVVHGLLLDRNCSLQVNGSIATTGSHGLVMMNNSDVVTDNLQVSGQSAGVDKVLMVNACRLCRNSSPTGSNIGSISFSGAGNIVTG